MKTPNFNDAEWRKSSWSGDNGGQCVEVAFADGAVGMRDSKDKGQGPILVFTPGEFNAFVRGVMGGEFSQA